METELRLARLETFLDQLVTLCGGSFLDDFNLGSGLVQYFSHYEVELNQDEQKTPSAFDQTPSKVSLRKIAEQMQSLESRLYEDFCSKLMQDSREAALTKEIEEVKKLYVNKLELNDTLQKLHESFMQMCKEMKRLTKEGEGKLLERIATHERQNEERHKEFMETTTRLHSLAHSKLSQIDLDRSLQKITTLLKTYDDQIQHIQYVASCQENALQRIDEVILDKASKVDLQKVSLQFTEYYRKPEADKRLQAVSDSSEKIAEELKSLQASLDILSQITDELKLKQDNPRIELLEYRSLKQQVLELRTSLSHKAERAEVLSILDSKLGVAAIDPILEDASLNRRQTHMTAVMLLTTLRGLYTVGRDSMTSELKRRDHLMAQVENLVSWINSRHRSGRSTPNTKRGSALPSLDKLL